MTAPDTGPSLEQAREHLVMALRLRARVSKLKTAQARMKLARLGSCTSKYRSAISIK
jgi:hypothetical protein